MCVRVRVGVDVRRVGVGVRVRVGVCHVRVFGARVRILRGGLIDRGVVAGRLITGGIVGRLGGSGYHRYCGRLGLERLASELGDPFVALSDLDSEPVKRVIDFSHPVTPKRHAESGVSQIRPAHRAVLRQRLARPVGLELGHRTATANGDREDREDDSGGDQNPEQKGHPTIVPYPGEPMPLRLGQREFADNEFAVMAIINRTPDSFFDQGATFATDAALAAVDQAVADGADIVDIGGVKAGPGPDVDTAEEIERVAEFVALVRRRHPSLVISVDTWRAEVGRAVAAAGADLLNDAWGGHEPELAQVAASAGIGLVCSHAGGLPPRTDPHRVSYDDVVRTVVETVTGLAERAVSVGVRVDGIVIDPAHDFGKNTRHSLEVSRRLDELVATEWPVLVALSNKKFIGETLDLPAGERLTGTLAATAIAAWQGARVFRAHQVRETRQVLDMVASIRGDRPPAAARRALA